MVLAAGICLSWVITAGAQQAKNSSQNTQQIPPYHKSARDAKPLPHLLSPSNFADNPLVAKAYQIANLIPFVLAQQPCYCRCDKAFGHGSLLDCYASSHTAGCGICLKESFFAYQMTTEGKNPTQIREAIIHGDWKQADIKSEYMK
jgi:hypothetical protein